jgi:hypothetical protein
MSPTARQIALVIHSEISRVKACYEPALRAQPGLYGTVVVEFRIRPDGAVIAATGTGLRADVAACIAAVIKTLSFPPQAARSTIVRYPFVFRPATPSSSKAVRESAAEPTN